MVLEEVISGGVETCLGSSDDSRRLSAGAQNPEATVIFYENLGEGEKSTTVCVGGRGSGKELLKQTGLYSLKRV